MSQIQYKRKVSLQVSTETGDGLDLSNLRIAFDIKLTDSQTPNAARIRVYNLSQNLVSRIQKEFTYITLQAGYESNFGTIFYGNIKRVIYGSDNNVDTYIDIAAGDGDDAYNYSIVNTTLDGNVKQSDIVDAALVPMLGRGIERGFVARRCRVVALCTECLEITYGQRQLTPILLGQSKMENINQ
jgi:hypothetical protein